MFPLTCIVPGKPSQPTCRQRDDKTKYIFNSQKTSFVRTLTNKLTGQRRENFPNVNHIAFFVCISLRLLHAEFKYQSTCMLYALSVAGIQSGIMECIKRKLQKSLHANGFDRDRRQWQWHRCYNPKSPTNSKRTAQKM